MTNPAAVYIHANSARVGIRLACIHFQGGNTPIDANLVERILHTAPPNIIREEFALEVLAAHSQARQHRRRETAQQALTAMLHHAGDATLLGKDDMAKLAELAWEAAARFEEHDNVALQIDTIKSQATTG